MTEYTQFHRAYKYRLYPNTTQEAHLQRLSNFQCRVYNDMLHQREVDFERDGTRWQWQGQSKFWRQERNQYPELQIIPSDTLSCLAQRAQRAYEAWWRIGKETGDYSKGHPKSKSQRYFTGLEWRYTGRTHIEADGLGWGKLYLTGLKDEGIRIRIHRLPPDDSQPKRVILSRKNGHWYAVIQLEYDAIPVQRDDTLAVGIDIGMVKLLALADSDGNTYTIDNPRWYRDGQQKRRSLQRKLNRQRRANNPQNFNPDGTVKENMFIWHKSTREKETERLLAQHEEHIRQQRWYWWHTLTTDLVHTFRQIIIEDLTLDFMIKNKHLAMSVHDAGFNMFWQMLDYKAVAAGVEIVRVPPNYTSQRCSACGYIAKENRQTQANFTCVSCGYHENADINAARNMLELGQNGAVRALRDETEANGSNVSCEVQQGVAVATSTTP